MRGRLSMKQLHDDILLNSYLEQYKITSLFDTKGLPFRLCQYERGEILNNIHDPSLFLQFVVEGAVHIYFIRDDGQRSPVCLTEEFTLLGDMEFCGETSLPFLSEAHRKVICVELPLYEYRNILLNDNTFLRFLLHSIAHKMTLVSKAEITFSGLEEKLLHHLKYNCPDQQFQGVETTAIHLHCSRRQLQRILKSLTERKILEKQSKGTYKLVSHASPGTDEF